MESSWCEAKYSSITAGEIKMIIPENYLPKFMKNNWKYRVVISIILVLLTILFFYWQMKKIGIELIKGPDLYEELDLPITHDILDSVAIGLRKYRLDHGSYPKINGKYFFDSIKTYTKMSKLYIYADSINDSNDTIFVKNRGDVGWVKTLVVSENHDNYKDIQHSKIDLSSNVHNYIAVGQNRLYIVYCYKTSDSFLLYSVGKNIKDEHGHGDDVVYHSR
jgi:hypothetical protein